VSGVIGREGGEPPPTSSNPRPPTVRDVHPSRKGSGGMTAPKENVTGVRPVLGAFLDPLAVDLLVLVWPR